MENYVFFVSIAIIMLTTKILGDMTNKVNMPQVVGALLAGIIIGPSCLGLIEQTDFISKTAEIGVVLLMFTAGLDTDRCNRRYCSVDWRHGMLLFLFRRGKYRLRQHFKGCFHRCCSYGYIGKHHRRSPQRNGKTRRQSRKCDFGRCGNRRYHGNYRSYRCYQPQGRKRFHREHFA